MSSVYFNKGENCIAAGRLFVEESIHDEFISRVVSESKHWRHSHIGIIYRILCIWGCFPIAEGAIRDMLKSNSENWSNRNIWDIYLAFMVQLPKALAPTRNKQLCLHPLCLRWRRSGRWRSETLWIAPQTTAHRITKPILTSCWSTATSEWRRGPRWCMEADRWTDQVAHTHTLNLWSHLVAYTLTTNSIFMATLVWLFVVLLLCLQSRNFSFSLTNYLTM